MTMEVVNSDIDGYLVTSRSLSRLHASHLVPCTAYPQMAHCTLQCVTDDDATHSNVQQSCVSAV